jgi:hypothetical protein
VTPCSLVRAYFSLLNDCCLRYHLQDLYGNRDSNHSLLNDCCLRYHLQDHYGNRVLGLLTFRCLDDMQGSGARSCGKCWQFLSAVNGEQIRELTGSCCGDRGKGGGADVWRANH